VWTGSAIFIPYWVSLRKRFELGRTLASPDFLQQQLLTLDLQDIPLDADLFRRIQSMVEVRLADAGGKKDQTEETN